MDSSYVNGINMRDKNKLKRSWSIRSAKSSKTQEIEQSTIKAQAKITSNFKI